MLSSSSAKNPNFNQPNGSLFKSGISNFTVSEDEVDDKDDQNEPQVDSEEQFKSEHNSNELDIDFLEPPNIIIHQQPLSYEVLTMKCQKLEQDQVEQKKKYYHLLELVREKDKKIKALEEIEKAAYLQIDERLQQISELEAKNLILEQQNQELKSSLEQEQRKKKQEIVNPNSDVNQINAMLQIKDKQIQLLSGQLATLKAATQYRSQGSHHSNASGNKDKNITTNIINNNNRNQIIITTEILQGNIQNLINKTKSETPKKQQQKTPQDNQDTQRPKKNQSNNKQNDQVQTTSWLENLKNRNNETLMQIQKKQSFKESSKDKQNQSFTENLNKYIHQETTITKVNSPAFQRQTTYLSLNDHDNSLLYKAQTLKAEIKY